TRLGEETRAVEEKRKKAEKSVKRMEAARKEAQESVAGIRGRITGKFARLRKALDEDEKETLQRVAVKERELLSRIDKDIARHKWEIGELQAAAARLRALQHERDSLAFLQGHLKETRRREIPKESAPPPPTSLDATTILSLERVVNRFLPFACEFLSLAPTCPLCCTALLCSPPSSTFHYILPGKEPSEPCRSYYVYTNTTDGRSLTLDTNSASNDLQISSDLRTMTLSRVPQGRPHHPHRFECWGQALCSESFSSGQHYWEVDVGSAEWCRVGVAYGTIPRRGRGAEGALGESHFSWCLEKYGDSFSVLPNGRATSLSVPQPPRRVGVHLDWDEGLLSFYSTDSMVLLHSFTKTFTQPLHPGLGVWSGSVRIVDLSGAS
ncbi:unnamed protein product, partial [Lampetra planeri]